MNSARERLLNGLFKENPTFVLLLGMCPTLAVTVSASNGLGMGLTTAVVLTLSNLIISLLRGIIPKRVRIPAFIVIIASFVTILQLLLEAYLPSLNESLGVYIPLIVVNCIILGRAESYAYHNPPVPSMFDGLGMGLGFTLALTLIGAFRELLGAGTVFNFRVMPHNYEPIRIFVVAPGAFFVLALLVAFQNFLKSGNSTDESEDKDDAKGCMGDCANCMNLGCEHRFYDTSADTEIQNDSDTGLSYEEISMEEAVTAEPVTEENITEENIAEENITEEPSDEEPLENITEEDEEEEYISDDDTSEYEELPDEEFLELSSVDTSQSKKENVNSNQKSGKNSNRKNSNGNKSYGKKSGKKNSSGKKNRNISNKKKEGKNGER